MSEVSPHSGDYDPREIIKTFIVGLPQTIRDDLLLFVIVYGMNQDVPKNLEEFEPIVRAHLSQTGMPAIGAVIRLTAVIDHELDAKPYKHDRAESDLKALVERHPDNIAFQVSYFSFPMRRRHWEQAADSWRSLRATKLTAQTLRDFADSQLMPQRLK